MSTQPGSASALTASFIERESTLLDRIAEETQRSAARYMPTLSVAQFGEREKMLRELKALLVENIDYGVIPGTGTADNPTKPVLLKPGAEKLCAFFGYAPHYSADVIEDWDGAKYGEPLFYYKYTCVLAKDGKPVGEGQGSCNSWETKYRYRNAGRKCPHCGASSIIKGKENYGGGWVCFGKKGGCGAKFRDGDRSIEGQEVGRIANPDFADLINTIQKMGQKRAMVAAVLSATGASQYFTQDVEDAPEPPESREKGPTRVDGGHSVVKESLTTQPVTAAAAARKVPEELVVVVDKLRNGDYSDVKKIGSVVERECRDLGIGAAYTNRAAGIRSSYPKGAIIPASVMETFLLDVWDEIEAARARRSSEPAVEPKSAPAESQYAEGVTTDDVPF